MAWQQKCHLGSWVPSSQGCWRSVTMATPNELNLVTDPYLFLICGPLGTLAGNQLENNLVTYQKENYLYLFIYPGRAHISLWRLCQTKDTRHIPSAFSVTVWKHPALHCEKPCQTPMPLQNAHTHKLPWISVLMTTDILPKSCLAFSPRLAHVDKQTPTPLLGWFNILCWYPLIIFFCALSLCWNMILLWNIFIWSRMAQHWCLLWAEDCLIKSCISASSLWQFYYYKFSRDMRAVHCG